jgi:hypothetical protein
MDCRRLAPLGGMAMTAESDMRWVGDLHTA